MLNGHETIIKIAIVDRRRVLAGRGEVPSDCDHFYWMMETNRRIYGRIGWYPAD